jgi:hypothetical protein
MASQALSMMALFCLTLPAAGAESIFDRRKERSGPLELARAMLKKDADAAKKHLWIGHTEQAYLALENMEKEMKKMMAEPKPHFKNPAQTETLQPIQELEAPVIPAMPAAISPIDNNDISYHAFMLFSTLAIASSILIIGYCLRQSFQPKAEVEKPLSESRKWFSWLQKEDVVPAPQEPGQPAASAPSLS